MGHQVIRLNVTTSNLTSFALACHVGKDGITHVIFLTKLFNLNLIEAIIRQIQMRKYSTKI